MPIFANNHSTDKSPLNDTFDLDRLADELAEREQLLARTNGTTETDPSSSTPDLPVPAPLSHDNPFLSGETFSIDEFLLSRSYTSLYDLRTELREYHATLKEELVQLINDDYEAFLSLSTDLRGEGARLERMKWPLGDMDAVITTSRAGLQELLDSIQEKMERRSALREEKTFLHLLLKVSDSVARLESMLLIAEPSQSQFEAAISPGATTLHSDIDGHSSDRATLNNKPKHLLRIATEFTQLQYHTEKAKPSKFVDELHWRIDRIKSTLSDDLESLFSKTLLAVTSAEQTQTDRLRPAEIDKGRSMSELRDCMKAYDMLGLWRDAEDVLRRDVVRSFIKKTVHPSSLTGPHSPVLPHTPLPQLSTRESTHPRTPFTPYTAFPSRQNPYKFGETASVYLLDDSDDPLAGLYNKILRFIDRDMKMIMETAEQFHKHPQAKTTDDMRLLATQSSQPIANESSENKGFDIFVNVVWDEVARAIMDELGPIVFSVGKPDEFRQHYETTQTFLRSLEYLSPSMEAVRKMRSSPRFESFTRRWQLPVYFQLRWKDIVTKVEEAMEGTPSLSVSLKPSGSSSSTQFMLKPTTVVWEAMCQCWSGNVYLPDLGHKFWRLTLQLLSRYRSWLSGCLDALDVVAGKSNTDKVSADIGSPSSRSGTPALDSQDLHVDDLVLQQCAIVLNDIKSLEQKAHELWKYNICELLPQISESSQQNVLEDTMKQSIGSILDLVPSVVSRIVVILTRRCCDALVPVKSLPGQFRATSHKNMPTKPSAFVPLIFRPLKVFFGVGTGDGFGKHIQELFGATISSDVVEAVSNRYVVHLTAMKKTEESLKRLKVSKKSGFSFFGGGSSVDDDARDEERLRRQLKLDVNAFEADAESLGVPTNSSPSFKMLSTMVKEDPQPNTELSST